MALILSGDTGPSIVNVNNIQNITGNVLQVVYSQNTNQVVISADGVVDLGVSASITVKAGSRVFVQGVVPVYTPGWAGAWQGTQVYIYEDATSICTSEHVGSITTSEAQCYQIPVNIMTGVKTAGTYTYYLKAARVISGDRYIKRDSRASIITLMEIVG